MKVSEARQEGQFKQTSMRAMAPRAIAPSPPAGKASSARRGEALKAYGMTAPFLILMAVFNLYVFASGFRLSLSDAQGISDGDYVGLQNYRDALWAEPFVSSDFWSAVKTTLLYTAGCLATQIPVAFVLAYVLHAIPQVRLRSVLRAAFFLPVLLNSVVTALLFRMFFNKDQGIVNHVLGSLGLVHDIDWLGNSQWAIPLLVAVSFWQWTGFHMVYFLAQLQTIDPTLYEVARIAGISSWNVLMRITVPLMRPAITFVMVTAAIGGLQMFDLVFMLFPNATYGPGGVARTLVAHVYDQGFSQQFLTGLASAIGWLTFLVIAAVSALQLKVLGLGRHGET